MNSNSDHITLYILIENRLKKNPPVSIPELRSYCLEEFKKLTKKELVLSEESLIQDISILKSLLQVPIKKSKITGCYYLNPTAISFLDFHLQKDPEHFKLIFNYIFGATSGDGIYFHVPTPIITKGWERIVPIRKAISERRLIKFNYRSVNGIVTSCSIIPYRIICKDLQWYVVGHSKILNSVSIYSLHRIFDQIDISEVIPVEDMPLDFMLYTLNHETSLK